MSELVSEYLQQDHQSKFQFWIADESNEVYRVVHQGVHMEPLKDYLNYASVKITLLSSHLLEIEKFASGWENKFPKLLQINGLNEVIGHDLRYKSINNNGEYATIEFIVKL